MAADKPGAGGGGAGRGGGRGGGRSRPHSIVGILRGDASPKRFYTVQGRAEQIYFGNPSLSGPIKGGGGGPGSGSLGLPTGLGGGGFALAPSGSSQPGFDSSGRQFAPTLGPSSGFTLSLNTSPTSDRDFNSVPRKPVPSITGVERELPRFKEVLTEDPDKMELQRSTFIKSNQAKFALAGVIAIGYWLIPR